MKTVLITGAAGGIGTRLRTLLKGVYPRLTLSDRETPADLQADEEFIQADLSDMAQVTALLRGVDDKVRPDSRYGVSKAFGEALGSFYAEKFGLGVLSIRIGNIDDYPVDERRLSIWVSPRDLVQLIRIGLEHPDLGYEIVWGASANARAWWDNEPAHRLGYRPQDHAEDHRDRALAAETERTPNAVADYFQGGDFCAFDFAGPTPEGDA